jgi:hypothetical protein
VTAPLEPEFNMLSIPIWPKQCANTSLHPLSRCYLVVIDRIIDVQMPTAEQ